MNAVAPASQPAAAINAQPAMAAPPATAAPQPAAAVAPLPVAAAAPNAAAEPDPAPAAAPVAPAAVANAAPAAAPPAAAVAGQAAAAANEAPAAREVSTIDTSDHAGKNKAGKGGSKVAARGAKSETPKGDAPAYDPPKEAPAAGGSFLQALGKTPELAGQAAAAPPAAAPAPAAEPAPAPPALPPAQTTAKPGLAAAMQKAGGAEGPPAAAPAAPRATAAAAPAAAAGPAPVTPAGAGVPDAPSQGAIASALQANNRAAKACVKGQEAPSRASVTFGSDGKVQTISISGPAVGTPAEECIKQALQKGNVGPFSRPSYNIGITIRP